MKIWAKEVVMHKHNSSKTKLKFLKLVEPEHVRLPHLPIPQLSHPSMFSD